MVCMKNLQTVKPVLNIKMFDDDLISYPSLNKNVDKIRNFYQNLRKTGQIYLIIFFKQTFYTTV